MDIHETSVRVENAAQLASLLEVSGHPKPGNVHRTRDFPDLRYEHFLAGSVAIGEPVREAAAKGYKAGTEKLNLSKIGVGEKINQGVKEVKNSHQGGNTHLGMILLFIPLSAAAGKTLAENEKINTETLRNDFKQIMHSSTSEDSLEVYEAVEKSIDLEPKKGENAQSSWLGDTEKTELSVGRKDTREKLSRENISLYEWMEVSAKWDGIARELTTNLEASFEIGYPEFTKTYEKHNDINIATVHTFLKILSKFPDTFIARKIGLEKTRDIAKAVDIGMEKAERVSRKAEKILEGGGLTTNQGEKGLKKLDEKLHKNSGKLNPGTTADITAASIMIGILDGLKY